jgi:hypothetical protein
MIMVRAIGRVRNLVIEYVVGKLVQLPKLLSGSRFYPRGLLVPPARKLITIQTHRFYRIIGNPVPLATPPTWILGTIANHPSHRDLSLTRLATTLTP